MKADPAEARRWQITTALAIAGPLVAVVVSWWLSAEATREEGLRAARREAYASMMSASSDCGVQAVENIGMVIGREAAEQAALESGLVDEDDAATVFNNPSVVETWAESELSTAERMACLSRMFNARAQVSMVTDSQAVRNSAQEVQSATLASINATGSTDPSDEDLNAAAVAMAEWTDALAEFEIVAGDDANAPTPLMPRDLRYALVRFGAAVSIVVLPALFILLLLRRIVQAEAASAAGDNGAEGATSSNVSPEEGGSADADDDQSPSASPTT